MRLLSLSIIAFGLFTLAAKAEQPADKPAVPANAAVDAYVKKMMAFDKKGDGKLTRDEITDERYLRVFDRADANKDGVVTKEELTALATQEVNAIASSGGGDGERRGGPGGGPGGGFFGGPGGGGRPQPGQIMPRNFQDALKLTDEQKKKFADLQKDVDSKVDQILTDDQKTQFKTLKERPPGRGQGGGPGGGPGGDGHRPGN